MGKEVSEQGMEWGVEGRRRQERGGDGSLVNCIQVKSKIAEILVDTLVNT